MPHVVKIFFNEDGEKQDRPKWHWVNHMGDSPRAFCTGEVFGIGEGGAVYETKEGKITCPSCIEMIKYIKAIKL